MCEKTKTALCLIVIAIGIAFVQTQDYNDQQQAETTVRHDAYIAWHNEMLAATGE